MKKTILLIALTLMGGNVYASSAGSNKPAPLSKRVCLEREKDTFKNCMDNISKKIEVEIKVDKDALARHGITQNQKVFIPLTICNIPAIDLINDLTKQIDQGEVTIVRVEKDGSVTITAK